jgi:zinc protease
MSMKKTSRALAVVATVGLLGVPAFTAPQAGQQTTAARQSPPPPGPLRPFTFPAYETRKLANGLTVFVIEDHRQPLVSYRLLLEAGASAHPTDKGGLAFMTAQLLRQGTQTRSSQDIATAIDRVGGNLGASADDDTALVSASVVKSAADLALELMADIVLRPAFKQDEIDRARRQVLSGLQINYTDAEYLAPVVAARTILGNHPYAFPVEGTPDTLRALTRDDIVAFHRARYSPAGAFMAVSGDIKADAVVAQLEQHFKGWTTPAPAAVTLPPPPPPARTVLVLDKPDAVQTQIVVGSVGIERSDPSYFPLLIANQIFGGSFNSRLNLKLRAQEGLTYGARSSFDTLRETGIFRVSTFTRTEETGKALAMILDLLEDFRKMPATEAELNEAKSYLVGSFVIANETPSQIAGRVLDAAKFRLPADYWAKYRDRVQAVTAADVAKAVRDHIDPARMAIVAVGNAKVFAAALDKLGKARQILFSNLDLMQPDLTRAAETSAPATPEAIAKGKAALRAAADALGGAKALGIKDLVSTGSITLSTPQGQLQGEFTTEVLYPDKIKSSIALPMGQMVQAFDGSAAWAQMGPQQMDLPAAMHAEMRRTVLLAGTIGVLREALEGRAQVQALEPVEADGRTLTVVNWTMNGQDVKLFVDAATHLPAKAAFRSVTPQGAADAEVRWTDYREVDGVKIAGTVTTYRGGEKYAETVVKEVRFNTGLDPASFGKPKS